MSWAGEIPVVVGGVIRYLSACSDPQLSFFRADLKVFTPRSAKLLDAG